MKIEALSYLGMDLGGTKLLIGEIDPNGAILSSKKYPSGYLDQARAVQFIQDSLEDYLRTGRAQYESPPQAMGLGLMGRVDNARGIWFQIDARRTRELEIAGLLSGRFNIPCYVENDVRSAVQAELRFGCGRYSDNFIYLNIGTGIAAGIVSGGRILRGANCNSGEVGHTLVGVDPGIPVPCECGRVNCVEAFASGMGLDVCARILAASYPRTSLSFPSGLRVSAAEIFEKSGSDSLCAHLVDTAARGIANLIMNLVRVSDPDTVVLGGGLVSDGFLLPRIQAALQGHTMRFVTHGVVLTQLDPAYAGLLGAGTVAMNRLS
jgi:predicted NBD/HSP70 family sugar kinase